MQVLRSEKNISFSPLLILHDNNQFQQDRKTDTVERQTAAQTVELNQ